MEKQSEKQGVPITQILALATEFRDKLQELTGCRTGIGQTFTDATEATVGLIFTINLRDWIKPPSVKAMIDDMLGTSQREAH